MPHFPANPALQVGILEYWDLSMQLFNARIKSPVKDWQVIKRDKRFSTVPGLVAPV